MGWANAIQGIGVAAGLWGAKKQGDAAKAQAKGAQAGLDWTKQVYKDAQGNFAPYLGIGQQGVGGLSALLNGDYSGFYSSPDYVAAREAMNYGLDHSAAARGRLYSGGYMADLSKAQGDLAAGYLGNYRNFLGSVAGMGQNAASSLGSLGNGLASNVQAGYNGVADARATQYGAQAAMLNQLVAGLGQFYRPTGTTTTNTNVYTNYGYGPQF
jgi:hypothetical protein